MKQIIIYDLSTCSRARWRLYHPVCVDPRPTNVARVPKHLDSPIALPFGSVWWELRPEKHPRQSNRYKRVLCVQWLIYWLHCSSRTSEVTDLYCWSMAAVFDWVSHSRTMHQPLHSIAPPEPPVWEINIFSSFYHFNEHLTHTRTHTLTSRIFCDLYLYLVAILSFPNLVWYLARISALW